MPVHDWSRVEDGIFHGFHHLWITTIHGSLNRVLPPGYYALPDQVAGPGHPDVLGLQYSRPPTTAPTGGHPGAVAVAEPTTRFRDTAAPRRPARRRKRVAIRHVSGDRIVALVEIVSASNKATRDEFRAFADKLAEYVDGGIHVLVLDILPPRRKDPNGIHPLIWRRFKKTTFELPPGKPLSLATYAAGQTPRAYVEAAGVGDQLPDMPLFLTPKEHVKVPLEPAYRDAWAQMPDRWREVLDTPAG
ncbi:MAG: DUF4058 family protein [Gemmataceae bacterium]|nr:DUF4058 family protein [Gemmataceae bacterium]